MLKDEKMVANAKEVSVMLGVGITQAYAIIRRLNDELIAKGYIVVRGKINRRYLNERTGNA